MPRQLILVAVVSVLTLGVAGPATSVSARFAQSTVVGHVYVNANTAPENTIAAFNRNADGTLTPLPGSPFAAGGAGTGQGNGSQDALRVTADGRYLLAGAAGSNEISVLRIAADGSVSPVAGSPFSSGGLVPVSIALHENLIYVANRGNGTEGANYTGFTLDDDGRLHALDDSTVPLSATANPGAVVFNGTGTNLVGTQVGPDDGPSFIDSFALGDDGRLTPAPGSPFPAQATGPTEAPSAPRILHHFMSSTPMPGPTTAAPPPTRSTRMGRCGRSERRPTRTGRPHPAGWPSLPTAAPSSPSILRSPPSHATRSWPTARSSCSAARPSTTRPVSTPLMRASTPVESISTSSAPTRVSSAASRWMEAT